MIEVQEGCFLFGNSRFTANAFSHSCTKLGNRDFVSKFIRKKWKTAPCDFIYKWPVKTSSVSCIEQILQFKVAYYSFFPITACATRAKQAKQDLSRMQNSRERDKETPRSNNMKTSE